MGFDWENPEQVLDKLHEELAEFDEARRNASPDELEDELGDLLFVLVNLARFVKVDPEQALRRTNAKFRAALRLHRAQAGRARQEAAGFQHRGDGGAVAGSQAVIEIRQLSQLDEFARGGAACSRRIWGFADIELLPLRFFVVASKVGGQVFGAYDGGRDGRVSASPCRASSRDRRPYLHSHMLGVLPEYRDRGHRAAAQAARSARKRSRAASS